MKKFFRYFVWTIVIGLIYYAGLRYELYLLNEAQMNYNFWPQVIFAALFPILIGILLRLPKLIKEIQQEKVWSVNWMKLLAVGLPTLYVSLVPVLLLTGLFKYIPFAMDIIHFDFATLAGVVFGYVLLDSLKED
ncbi:hypothetical protein B4U37_02670 [Sutcliffiella horikoshii]|uniref:Uncharacterized protein n=1 Tax=Sutcliffiella horikoshii TaxID=79883 RepID=A0ABM6KFH1_9BACI|nr:hypothetical protein [Sutcliffiella horikoshii]ART75014.1 hypothetical protein B4U37_02670 [Sutcliffiella horikoshii]